MSALATLSARTLTSIGRTLRSGAAGVTVVATNTFTYTMPPMSVSVLVPRCPP